MAPVRSLVRALSNWPTSCWDSMRSWFRQISVPMRCRRDHPGGQQPGRPGRLEPDERQAGGSSAGSRIAKDLRPTLCPSAAWACRTRTAVLTQPQEPVSHRPPLFTEELLLRRPAAARVAGFGAVGFWWPCAAPVPSDREVDAFVASVEKAGVGLVGLVGLNFFADDLAGRIAACCRFPAAAGSSATCRPGRPGRAGDGEHRAGGEGPGRVRRHGADRAGRRAVGRLAEGAGRRRPGSLCAAQAGRAALRTTAAQDSRPGQDSSPGQDRSP